MTDRVIAALPCEARRYLESYLPEWVDARWFSDKGEALTCGTDATVGWFDLANTKDLSECLRHARQLKWVFSTRAGVDGLPLYELAARSIVLTNSPGLAAPTVSEYVLLGMLSIAKGYREVVHAQARHEWLKDPPGTTVIMGSSALVIGYGTIGRMIETRLSAFGMAVTVVRRTPDPAGHALGPEQWRSRLGEFDWVILAAPATAETVNLIGAAELASMKKSAVLVNVARGTLVDQEALVQALTQRDIAAAFLDVTEPEPLPPGHPLWSLDNAHITMHLTGRSQTEVLARASQRFLDNLARFRKGEPLQYEVDLGRGY